MTKQLLCGLVDRRNASSVQVVNFRIRRLAIRCRFRTGFRDETETIYMVMINV